MKVSGFSFIKNAVIYDYPIVEAISSILPICDEFIVAVGESDDATMELIKGIDPNKIRIINTQWDESLRKGGRVLAVETDKAFKGISMDSDWAFYIQGDEVVHEKYLSTIYDAMSRYRDAADIDGLLFKYLHFYGSYDYVGTSSRWYNHEVRVIRNNKNIFSYKDAQGFRKGDNEKLIVYPVEAYIYHYGWAKEPKAMQRKQENWNKYYHDDAWVEKNVLKAEEFDYNKDVGEIMPFSGEHPEVIKKRVAEKNWKFDHDISLNRKTIKDKTKEYLKQRFGIDLYYNNYKLKKVPEAFK